MARLERR